MWWNHEANVTTEG